MDEQRIERALREGPPDEPAYSPALATRLDADGSPLEAVRRASVSPHFGLANLIASVALIVVAVLVVLPLAQQAASEPSPPASRGDLLAALRSDGVIQIAVTNGHPQTTAAGDAVIGFDVDVARELGQALGLRVEVTALPAGDILAGRGAWDIGLPSSGEPAAPGLTQGPAYYAWPAWLVVPDASLVDDGADLAGASVCAVSGSAGLGWLAGGTPPDGAGASSPAGARALERPRDAACLDAVRSGDAAAAVTAALLDTEIAGEGFRAVDSEPVLEERRPILVRGTGADVETLVSALDTAISGMHASGRLAALSRSAFGGLDLTAGIR